MMTRLERVDADGTRSLPRTAQEQTEEIETFMSSEQPQQDKRREKQKETKR